MRASSGTGRARHACVIVLVVALAGVLGVRAAHAQASGAHVPPGRMLVWPRDPATSPERAERVLAEAGYQVVPFAPLASRLRVHGERAHVRETEVLERAARTLDSVRQAYVEQRFGDMIAALSALEQTSLDVLGQPAHIPVLWEVSFQLGLAHRARNQAGDAAAARSRFVLALALAPERRPLRELYGPDVSAAFADALGAHAGMLPRPVRVRVTPADAVVAIDGMAVLDRAGQAEAEMGQTGSERVAQLRPGLHLVRVSAPGFEPLARLITVAEQGRAEIALALVERNQASAVDRIGASWSQGELLASTASGLRAIRAAAAEAGAEQIVILEASPARGAVTAQLVSHEHSHEPVQRSTTAEAVRAALSTAAPGALVAGPMAGPGPGQERAPLVRRWWFWASVGAVAASAAIVAATLARDHGAERWQIVAPR